MIHLHLIITVFRLFFFSNSVQINKNVMVIEIKPTLPTILIPPLYIIYIFYSVSSPFPSSNLFPFLIPIYQKHPGAFKSRGNNKLIPSTTNDAKIRVLKTPISAPKMKWKKKKEKLSVSMRSRTEIYTKPMTEMNRIHLK